MENTESDQGTEASKREGEGKRRFVPKRRGRRQSIAKAEEEEGKGTLAAAIVKRAGGGDKEST